jgi:hypothetical protein
MAQQQHAYAPRGMNGMQSVQQGAPSRFPSTVGYTILSNFASAGLTETDLEKGFEEQHRWARTCMPDLYPRHIHVLPGIDFNMTSVVPLKGYDRLSPCSKRHLVSARYRPSQSLHCVYSYEVVCKQDDPVRSA